MNRPARTQSSAGDVAAEPPLVRAAPPPARARSRRRSSRRRRRSLTTCTSRASASPGATVAGSAVGDHDHRPAGVDDRGERQLRHPLVVEHAPRDQPAARRRAGRSRTRRSAGTSAGAASRCGGAARSPGTPGSPCRHASNVGEPPRRHALVEHVLLQPVVPLEPVPVAAPATAPAPRSRPSSAPPARRTR